MKLLTDDSCLPRKLQVGSRKTVTTYMRVQDEELMDNFILFWLCFLDGNHLRFIWFGAEPEISQNSSNYDYGHEHDDTYCY